MGCPQLKDATWPEARSGGLVLVPIGSCEQHGPHLPLNTDTIIAEAVSHRLGEELGAWVAPALVYGASGEHQAFPGTVSLGTPALEVVLVELVRSLATWADAVVLVNGHGGNRMALERSVGRLVRESHAADWVACEARGDAHAGRTETSILLHLRPSAVRLDLLEPGNRASLGSLLPALMDDGVHAVSPNGVLGDPTGATPAEGARVLEEMVAGALARIRGSASLRARAARTGGRT